MSDIDLIADAREWLASQGGRIQTHSEICHRWHPACLVSRLLSRAGQSEAKRRDFDADCPERETDHDAAPAAIAQTDSASCGRGCGGTDKPVTLPVLGTGDTPEPHATPGQGTSQCVCTLTAEEREAIQWAADTLCVGWADLKPDDRDRSRKAADALRRMLDRTQTGGK